MIFLDIWMAKAFPSVLQATGATKAAPPETEASEKIVIALTGGR